MSRLGLLAEELRALGGPQEGPRPRPISPPTPEALARTAIDYVMTQITESDDHETLGAAITMAASALALELGLDPQPVIDAASNFLFESALTSATVTQRPLMEAKGDDLNRLLGHATHTAHHSLQAAVRKLQSGDKAGARNFLRMARIELERVEKRLG